jgi:hypothetical protein
MHKPVGWFRLAETLVLMMIRAIYIQKGSHDCTFCFGNGVQPSFTQPVFQAITVPSVLLSSMKGGGSLLVGLLLLLASCVQSEPPHRDGKHQQSVKRQQAMARAVLRQVQEVLQSGKSHLRPGSGPRRSHKLRHAPSGRTLLADQGKRRLGVSCLAWTGRQTPAKLQPPLQAPPLPDAHASPPGQPLVAWCSMAPAPHQIQAAKRCQWVEQVLSKRCKPCMVRQLYDSLPLCTHPLLHCRVHFHGALLTSRPVNASLPAS